MRQRSVRLPDVSQVGCAWDRKVSGQTLVEYGLILIVVAVVCIVGLAIIGRQPAKQFDQVSNIIP